MKMLDTVIAIANILITFISEIGTFKRSYC